MAAAAPIQVQPAPLRLPKHRDVSQMHQEPFDATVLVTKLEAHRRQQAQRKAFQRQEVQNNLMTEAHGTLAANEHQPRIYVPRNAANQFASTTTPKPNGGEKGLGRAATTKIRDKPDFSHGPKTVQAATVQAAPDLNTVANQPPNHGKDRSGSTSEAEPSNVKRRASDSAYRPGDAARRNAGKRSSLTAHAIAQVQAQHRIAEQEQEQPDSHSSPTHAWLDSAIHPDAEPVRRPVIDPRDRPNWSQQSQCGSDMHSLLHWTKTERRPSAPQSQGSVGLVNEAVMKIKQEEKARRRKTFFGVFRRGSRGAYGS